MGSLMILDVDTWLSTSSRVGGPFLKNSPGLIGKPLELLPRTTRWNSAISVAVSNLDNGVFVWVA